MSEKILAQKTDKHFAVATGPAVAALPKFARSVPSTGPATVKFGISTLTSVKTKANDNLLFLSCSTAIGPKTDLFIPNESDPKNPIEVLGFACYHGHKGKIFFPNGIKTAPPLDALINAGVVDSNAECKNRLAVAISQMADKAMAEISSPIDFYKNFKKAELAVVEKTLGQYKDMGASLYEGAKNALGAVFDYFGNPVERARVNQQALDLAQSLPGKAQSLYNSTVQGASDLLDKAKTLSQLSPAQMQEAVQEWLTEQFGELPCEAASMAEDMLKSGKTVAEMMGELSGEVKVQVVEAGVTVAAGLVTGGAGAVAMRSAAVARMARTAKSASGVLDRGSDMLSKLFTKLENKALGKRAPTHAPTTTATPPGAKPTTAAKEPPPASGAVKEGDKPNGEGPACPIGCNRSPVPTPAPVNSILGCKSLSGETELDFALPALYPLVWQRSYVSKNPLIGWLGQGWSVPVGVFIETTRTSTDVVDDLGRRIKFPLLEIGRKFFSRFEGFTLHHTGEDVYLITSLDGAKQEFETKSKGKYRRFYMTSQFDRNENTLRMQYDETTGLPQLAIDSAGRKYAFEFIRRAATKTDAGHRLQEVNLLKADQTKQLLVRYEYDSVGDLTVVRNRLNEVVREFTYKDHLMVKHSQPGGLVAEYEYDNTSKPDKARVVRSWDNTGRTYAFEYSRGRSNVTDHTGRSHTLLSDKNQEWTGHINYDKSHTSRELDSYKNLVAQVDELGRSTRYEYNLQSQVTRVTGPDGASTSIAYDGDTHQVSQVTDALGHSTQYAYDKRGNLVHTIDALNQVTRYELDGNGQATRIHDAKGGVVQLAYNTAGQVTHYTDCSQKTTHYRYDAVGNLTEVTNALGQSTRYEYNALDRLVATHHADDTTERYTYDPLGRLVAHTDAAGQSTKYTLRPDGLPVKRTNPLGHSLQYEYDSSHRLAKLINENGAAYAFSYDNRDRLVEERGFDSKRTQYQYNAASELLQKTDAPGIPEAITTHYQRDAAGRVLQKRIGKTATLYQYTPLGQLAAVKNAFSHVQLSYDAAGSLIEEAGTSHGVATRLAHSHDPLGNRTSTTLPDGRVINHLYYGSGHLHQINVDGQVISDFERDDLHRERQRSQGRLDSHCDYHSLGRLVSQRVARNAVNNSAVITQTPSPAGASQASLLERYDKLGQLTELQDQRSGKLQNTIQYHYDPLGRLEQAGNERFAFDPAHNLIDADGSASTTAQVPGRYDNNRLMVYQEKRFTYDAHGNLTLKKTGAHTTLALHWDSEHQLVRSRSTQRANTNAPVVQDTRYAYDAFGRRVSKTDRFGTTHFHWDGNRLLGEHRGSRSVLYLYEPGSFAPLAQLETATVTVATAVNTLEQGTTITALPSQPAVL
jgi:YD repeat-containing protein